MLWDKPQGRLIHFEYETDLIDFIQKTGFVDDVEFMNSVGITYDHIETSFKDYVIPVFSGGEYATKRTVSEIYVNSFRTSNYYSFPCDIYINVYDDIGMNKISKREWKVFTERSRSTLWDISCIQQSISKDCIAKYDKMQEMEQKYESINE